MSDQEYRRGVARVAREAARLARERNDWNQDTIERMANAAVAEAFEDFAADLESAPDDGG